MVGWKIKREGIFIKTQKILKTLMFINISFLLLNRRMKTCLNLNVAKRQRAQNATVKCGRWDRRRGGGGGGWSSGSGNGGRYAVECGGYVCMMLSSEIHCRLRQCSEVGVRYVIEVEEWVYL